MSLSDYGHTLEAQFDASGAHAMQGEHAFTLPRDAADRDGSGAAGAGDMLAREADHRIRNSLQTVIALLRVQAKQAAQDQVRDALRVAASRVEAVSQVHAALHAAAAGPGEVATKLNLAAYLADLCGTLATSLGLEGRRRLLVDVEPLAVSPEQARLLGLVVTELVLNAGRHAFAPDHVGGTVRVLGARRRDQCYQLCVADDGRGLPSGFDLRLARSGLGMRIVTQAANQLRARVTADGSAGTRFMLTLPTTLDSHAG